MASSQVSLTSAETEIFARQIQINLARRNFWDYCQAVDPDFYTDDQIHLNIYCNVLNDLYLGKLLDEDGKPYKKLISCMPPQHGKTRTLVHFCEWMLGQNQKERIITASYNDGTAGDFSRYVRDGIIKEKLVPEDIVFSDIFPHVKMKKGHSGFEKWALQGEHFNYMGVGIGGSVTSKGATVQIIDDLIKNAKEAYNANHLNGVWLWYVGTFLSRVSAEGGIPIKIINMTRWSKKDPIGKILRDPALRKGWYVINMRAHDPKTDTMLSPKMLSLEAYKDLQLIMDRGILNANYNQEPIEIQGQMYESFNTYVNLPTDEKGNPVGEGIFNYTDTADEGKDFLCSICYLRYNGLSYVLDVYYTREKMEVTEPKTAEMLYLNDVGNTLVESNNGGKGFARNVARIYFEKYKRRLPHKWFHQSANKNERIFSESARVTNEIVMPENWMIRWPEFADALLDYSREGKNDHDDAPDCITGCVEMFATKKKVIAIKRP